MAFTHNRLELVGRIGNDPTVRTTEAGQPMASFSVATDRPSKDGARVTDWHAVVCFGAQADFVARYLSRGRLVFVAGRLGYRTYDDQHGQSHRIAEVIAQEVGALDRPPQPEPAEEGAGDAGQ